MFTHETKRNDNFAANFRKFIETFMKQLIYFKYISDFSQDFFTMYDKVEENLIKTIFYK